MLESMAVEGILTTTITQPRRDTPKRHLKALEDLDALGFKKVVKGINTALRHAALTAREMIPKEAAAVMGLKKFNPDVSKNAYAMLNIAMFNAVTILSQSFILLPKVALLLFVRRRLGGSITFQNEGVVILCVFALGH